MPTATPGPGHNSADEPPGEVSGERLRSFVQRIEKLIQDRTDIGADITDIYAEAKGAGFDVKILRQVIRNRKIAIEDRREQEQLLDLYMSAIGE